MGALALAVFASQLFALTRAVVNRAFRVRQRRRFLHGLLFDLFVVALLGTLAVGFAGAMALAALGELALGALPPPFTVAVRLRRLFSMPVLSALAVGLLFVVYRTFPNTRVPARAAAIATVAVAPLWELARRIFTAYVSGVGVYGMLYGSLGIGVAALVWIYVSATIFVLGAELAAVVTERSAGPAPSAPTAGSHGWTEGTHRVGERAPQDGTS
ncbi:MAG TPA: YihY/virulence factor BrkB family protein [Methylomirabilota bacterium]|nr:YihY/virulence factor BrkB family protein [Methylomirabilota bacterium]